MTEQEEYTAALLSGMYQAIDRSDAFGAMMARGYSTMMRLAEELYADPTKARDLGDSELCLILLPVLAMAARADQANYSRLLGEIYPRVSDAAGDQYSEPDSEIGD